jgi:cytochrome b6-f complex iron-sulfur subunit
MSDTQTSSTNLTRRELLTYAGVASLGFFTLQMAGISYLFALPRLKAGDFGGVLTVGPISDLLTTAGAPQNNPAGKFWLVQNDKGVLALYKVCTHLDCLSSWNEQAGHFICPCHGSQFAADGTYISGPAPRSLDRFVVRLLGPDGAILAETDPATGAPLPVPNDLPPGTVLEVDTSQKITGAPPKII